MPGCPVVPRGGVRALGHDLCRPPQELEDVLPEGALVEDDDAVCDVPVAVVLVVPSVGSAVGVCVGVSALLANLSLAVCNLCCPLEVFASSASILALHVSE